MRRGWGGNVYGIDIGVVDKLLGICVPMGDVMPLGIRLCFLFASAHNSIYRRTGDETESRAAFLFCHLATTDESPPNFLIYCHLLVKFSYYGCKDTQKKCNFAV
jgi:hypothetical protein